MEKEMTKMGKNQRLTASYQNLNEEGRGILNKLVQRLAKLPKIPGREQRTVSEKQWTVSNDQSARGKAFAF